MSILASIKPAASNSATEPFFAAVSDAVTRATVARAAE